MLWNESVSPVETPIQAADASPVGVPPRPWGVPAILLALAVPALLWGSSLGITIAQGSPDELSSGEIIVNLVLTVIILDGIFIAVPAAFCLWRYRMGWDTLGLRPFDRDFWWVPLAAAAASHIAIIVYTSLLLAFGAEGAAPEQEDIDQLFESPAVLPLTGVATVIMAPLAEEIFFRGFIFAGLIRPLGLYGAMITSGLLFGVFHITSADTVGVLLPFGAVGVLFAWIYHKTGSLWPCIATHVLFNLISFVILASLAGSGSG